MPKRLRRATPRDTGRPRQSDSRFEEIPFRQPAEKTGGKQETRATASYGIFGRTSDGNRPQRTEPRYIGRAKEPRGGTFPGRSVAGESGGGRTVPEFAKTVFGEAERTQMPLFEPPQELPSPKNSGPKRQAARTFPTKSPERRPLRTRRAERRPGAAEPAPSSSSANSRRFRKPESAEAAGAPYEKPRPFSGAGFFENSEDSPIRS